MMRDRELLIEIYSPANRVGEFQEIGTGYPVGPGRVLTARHVLGETENSKIQVRWHNQHGSAREWRDARIVWERADLDVAVLECDAPDGLQNQYGSVSGWEPRDNHRWNSLGFPRCGWVEDKDKLQTKPTPLNGTCHQRHSLDDTFHLLVDGVPSLPGGWKGVSGCPVFVDGSIIGVVVQCPENFDQERLLAVSAQSFSQDPAFQEALHRPKVNPHRTRVRKALIEGLQQNDWLRQSILAREAVVLTAEGLTDRLLNKPLHEFLFVFRLACRDAEGTPDRDARQSVISRLALLAPPVLVDLPADERPSAGVATRTHAEIMMASLDQRNTKFVLTNREAVGEYEIPVPPPSGFEDIHGTFSDQFTKHIYSMSAFDDIHKIPENKILQIINDFLDECASLQETRYFSMSKRDFGDESLFADFTYFLSSRYKSLRLIQLDKDEEHYRVQVSIARLIAFFLSHASGSAQ